MSMNEESRRKAEMLLVIIQESKSDGKFPPLTAYDVEWLAIGLLESDNILTALESKHHELDKMLAEANQRIEDELEGPGRVGY